MKLVKRLNLLQKVTIVFVVFIMLPTGLFSIYLYSSNAAKMYQQALADKQTAISQIANNQAVILDTLMDRSSGVAYRSSIVKLLSRSNLSEFPSWYASYFNSSLAALRYTLTYQSLGIRHAFVFSMNDAVEEKDLFYHSRRLEEQPFYQDYLRGGTSFGVYLLQGQAAQSYYACRETRAGDADSVVLCVREIIGTTDDTLLGLLVFELAPEQVFSPLLEANAQGGAYSIFLADGSVYGAEPPAEVFSNGHLLAAEDGNMVRYERRDYFYAALDHPPMVVVDSGFVNEQSYRSPALRISIIFIWLMVIQFLILFFIMRYIFGAMNDNLNQMDEIIQNNFKGRLAVQRQDEIGEIVQRYNLLLNHIDELVQDLVQKELAGKNVQIKALQYQINPHFIYNTLNIFSGNAEKNGNYELSEAISTFGHLLRYNIRDDGLYATIADELENAAYLVRIYKLRSRGILQLTTECDAALGKRHIIKSLVQPLLENSILHGRHGTDDDMHIHISVARQGEHILLDIRDDGAGMSAGRLDEVRGHVFAGQPLPSAPTGGTSFIGLRNVYRRILLFYGDTSSMEIDSEEGRFARILIRFPYDKTQEA